MKYNISSRYAKLSLQSKACPLNTKEEKIQDMHRHAIWARIKIWYMHRHVSIFDYSKAGKPFGHEGTAHKRNYSHCFKESDNNSPLVSNCVPSDAANSTQYKKCEIWVQVLSVLTTDQHGWCISDNY